ncbi:hypothetical protein [Paenibacillus sp. 1P07SE]|uniref:hypothetical protein n=1 Tax=Paenibacillus sp. 1P07SE TaxID=3132209 RepID=UPI0039A6CB9C
MKGYYRLINYELRSMMKGLLGICLGTIALQLLLLQLTVSSMSRETALLRYEDLYAASGGVVAFTLMLALLLVLFAVNVYGNYWGSKSIYTLLTLPLARSALYWSKLSAYALGLLAFLVSHLLGMRLGYGLVQGAVDRFSGEDWTIAGGWFLAVIRSSFFRLLLPMTWEGLLSSFSLALVLLTGLYFALLCERSRRFDVLPLVAVALFFIIRELMFRTAEASYEEVGFFKMYLNTIAMLSLSGLFMLLGSRFVRERAIA